MRSEEEVRREVVEEIRREVKSLTGQAWAYITPAARQALGDILDRAEVYHHGQGRPKEMEMDVQITDVGVVFGLEGATLNALRAIVKATAELPADAQVRTLGKGFSRHGVTPYRVTVLLPDLRPEQVIGQVQAGLFSHQDDIR